MSNTAIEAQLPSGRLRYHDVGTGPALVMLHGGGPGATGWSNFGGNVPTLAKRFRLIIPDQPGYGGTPMPAALDEHYVRFTARLIDELLERLDLGVVHLLGNSLGTASAVRAVLDFPHRYERLALMGPAGTVSPGPFYPRPTHGYQMVQEFYADPTRERLATFLGELAYDPSLITQELLEERFAATADPEVAAGAARMLKEYAKPDHADQLRLWQHLHTIEHETLIMWGLDDRVNPWDGAFFAMQALPNAQLHVWSRCGHWAQVEKAPGFERLLTDFLLEGN